MIGKHKWRITGDFACSSQVADHHNQSESYDQNKNHDAQDHDQNENHEEYYHENFDEN